MPKKNTTPAREKRASLKLSTPANVRELLGLLDKGESDLLVEAADEIVNQRGVDMLEVFRSHLASALRAAEQNRGRSAGDVITRRAYGRLALILKKAREGTSLEEIDRELNARYLEGIKRAEAEADNAPEPQDELSDDWRYWKIRRIANALRYKIGNDHMAQYRARDAARAEFKALVFGLLADPQDHFWTDENTLALLPHLLILKQRIGRDAQEGGAK